MLIQAVCPHGRALELIPDGYSSTLLRLDILGVLSTRFDLVGNTKDLGQPTSHYPLTRTYSRLPSCKATGLKSSCNSLVPAWRCWGKRRTLNGRLLLSSCLAPYPYEPPSLVYSLVSLFRNTFLRRSGLGYCYYWFFLYLGNSIFPTNLRVASVLLNSELVIHTLSKSRLLLAIFDQFG